MLLVCLHVLMVLEVLVGMESRTLCFTPVPLEAEEL